MRPLINEVPIPTPGPEPLWFAPTPRALPARFLETSGLSAFEVEPDLVVIEGPEETLAKLDREMDAWWARNFPAIRIRGSEVDLPVAGGSSGYIAAGRLLPVAHSVETSNLNGYIREAPTVGWILAGKSTVFSFPEADLLRMQSVSGEVLSSADRRIRFPLAEATGPREVDLPRTELRVETKAKTTDLPLDGTQRDGLTAKEEGE